MKLILHCSLCTDEAEFEFSPNGWEHRYDDIEDENALCPKHAPINAFFGEQCPGCVGGWHECDLGRAFMYRENLLTVDDMAAIRSGVCPKRTNGSMIMRHGNIETLDLSRRATSKSGTLLANAIEEYRQRWGGINNATNC